MNRRVIFTVYIEDEKKTFEFTFRSPHEVDVKLKEIRELGYMEKVFNNEMNWYPPNQIRRVNYKIINDE